VSKSKTNLKQYTFFSKFIADTSFALSKRENHVKNSTSKLNFTFPNFEIICSEELEQVEERYAFKGVTFESMYPALNMKVALNEINNSIINILSLLTFSSLAPWRSIYAITLYEADTDKDAREFYAYFYPHSEITIQKTIRVIDHKIFEIVRKSFDKIDNKNNVLAALHQLNKALQAETDVDEFLAYWTGIEYLKLSLYRKRGYTPKNKYYDCPVCGKALEKCAKCGKELAMHNAAPGDLQGVREIATEKLNMSNTYFNKLVKVRGNLIHGGAWDKFSDSYKYKNTVRELLVHCIGSLMDLGIETTKAIASLDPIIRNRTTTEAKLIYNAKLTGVPCYPSPGESYLHPEVQIVDEKQVTTTVNEDGSISVSETNTYTHKGPETVKWNNINKTIMIHKKSGAKNLALNFEEKENN